ncbi:unnamed protein product [Ilex paraguariensis]|uniref:Uncharacterized protein n=1 Tax=Ilex paraguariensis TaxID=185542 RepID=A0ABC8RST8_9AQUA
MFVSLSLKGSVAYSHQAMEKTVVAADHEFAVAQGSPVIVGKEIFGAVPTEAEDRNEKLTGRKMMLKRVLGKEMVTKEVMNNGQASKSSGATHSAGNCGHKEKGKLNVQRKLSDISTHNVKIKMDNFMAFNADYNVPRPHPPKNN